VHRRPKRRHRQWRKNKLKAHQRENNHSQPCAALLRFASDPPAVPRRKGDCNREACLLMCHAVCFEAGRFTQTQSSWTALCRSRKWMSGHADADALTQFVTDRKRQIVQQLVGPTTALQKSLPSAGEVLFSLDKPLSWMSPFRFSLFALFTRQNGVNLPRLRRAKCCKQTKRQAEDGANSPRFERVAGETVRGGAAKTSCSYCDMGVGGCG